MNIKHLTLHNFWSHKHTDLAFTESFYMILGKTKGSQKSNGSGKSTIARGIAYALYGDASDEINNEAAIYNDAKDMQVELTFELNGKDYTVARKMSRKGSPSVIINDVKHGVKAGQQIINDLLGADFSIFKNTSYFKQGDISSFSTLTPKEAKEVVIKILQLDNYNSFEGIAKEKMSESARSSLNLQCDVGNIDNQINDLSDSVKSISDTEYEELKQKLDNLKSKKAEAIVAIEQRDKELAEVVERRFKVDKLVDEANYKVIELEGRIKKIQGLNGTCPTCEHTLNEDIKKEVIVGLESELKPYIEKRGIYSEEAAKITAEALAIRNREVDNYQYDQEIAVTSQKIGEVKTQLRQAEEQHDKIKDLKFKKLEKSLHLQDHNERKEIYSKLQEAFGKKGIQAYIIDNVIPEIQATTNDILASLDTPIRINIESQKELKKGGKSETLEISVLTEFGERPYTNYSGGEKTFIDFALRIALSVILTRRSNSKIQTLILDEVFGELDTVNKRIISQALRIIANKFDFKKILIISHAEELQDSFENIIRVVFDGESSHIIKEKEYAN